MIATVALQLLLTLSPARHEPSVLRYLQTEETTTYVATPDGGSRRAWNAGDVLVGAGVGYLVDLGFTGASALTAFALGALAATPGLLGLPSYLVAMTAWSLLRPLAVGIGEYLFVKGRIGDAAFWSGVQQAYVVQILGLAMAYVAALATAALPTLASIAFWGAPVAWVVVPLVTSYGLHAGLDPKPPRRAPRAQLDGADSAVAGLSPAALLHQRPNVVAPAASLAF